MINDNEWAEIQQDLGAPIATTPVPPHYYRDRAQRRKQREQENNDNAN